VLARVIELLVQMNKQDEAASHIPKTWPRKPCPKDCALGVRVARNLAKIGDSKGSD
jgi:hypothetical protein